jgi:hypothetical protein
MKGILDFLARANLLELSEDEKQTATGIATGSAAEVVVAPEAEHPSPPEPLPLSTSELEVAEGKSFEEVFAAAAVSASPYPAEKLLRLLDGLRAMDSATRKIAVLAMDAADDSWQIADCVSDAQQKIAALGAYKQYLGAQLQGSEQQASAKVTDIRTELETASAAIRQQIAELEQLLERKITQSAQQTAGIETGLRAKREAVAREARRLDSEIDRLREIPAQFTAAAPASN